MHLHGGKRSMNKKEFRRLCKERFIILDGATGSNLMEKGMPAGVCPEKWILEHPEAILELQKAYVASGTNILYAPTFTANSLKLKEYGLEGQAEEINRKLVRLSKEAAGGKAYVAADLTMTGIQLAPIGPLDFEELVEIYKEQITYDVEAGADLIVVETMMSLQETRAAVIAAKEVCDLPVMCTLTFEKDGRTLYGTDAETAAIVLTALGADAVGANCSTGPEQMAQIIEQMARVTDIPIIAKPNAGLPSLDENGRTVYLMKPEEFVAGTGLLLQAGATILGGCCGTTPEFIRQLAGFLREKDFTCYTKMREGRREKGLRYLTSERGTWRFGLDDPFFIVGERINPTGKKKLQAELREGSFDMVRSFAEQQEQCGAKVLDINMGMSGIDEKAVLLKALDEVAMTTNLPLAIDSSHVEVIEAALRRYPGRALINSISYESAKFENLLPIAAKYGAMFILLPLSDAGLPKDLEEKIGIIGKIRERAKSLGFTDRDIVVDGLVATVGANKNAAIETLQTIRYCKEQGLATICGLSNISFGLPERTYVNTAFLTMAIREGLTMAIANPSQEMLVSAKFASDLLLNKDGADIAYIEYMNAHAQEREAKASVVGKGVAAAPPKPEKTSNAETPPKSNNLPQPDLEMGAELQAVYNAVLKGNKSQIAELTKTAVERGFEPKAILDTVLMPAINLVGELFEKGRYFLPQLISSAEAMKLSIEYLEPMLVSGGTGEELPVIVIATVEGDIHDIGKNLVALMLKNYGFRVIDLGKDVPAEKIMEAVKEHGARIIALSALMTTTMQEMRHVIACRNEQGLQDVKVMIGGAVITQEYADEIGADGYSRDAAEAVKVAKRLLGMKE